MAVDQSEPTLLLKRCSHAQTGRKKPSERRALHGGRFLLNVFISFVVFNDGAMISSYIRGLEESFQHRTQKGGAH